jgi:hypothetical protein
MNLTLIRPNIGRMEHSLYVDEARMEPLALGVLAAMTPPDVEVALYDDRMEPTNRPTWSPSMLRPLPPGGPTRSAQPTANGACR